MIEKVLEAIALNALLATAVAGLVALVAHRLRHPGLVHALWLLVLVKLVTPPLVQVGSVLPAGAPWPTVETAPVGGAAALGGAADLGLPSASIPSAMTEGPAASDASGIVAPVPADRRPPIWPALSPKHVLLGLEGTGLLLLAGFALVRAARFRRLVRAGRPADGPLRDRVKRIAGRLRVSPAPPVRIVDAPVSPVLWTRRGRPELVLPSALLPSLGSDELDAILAHELAHIRRRDHWIRPLEVLVVSVFWWHPVAWWARRNLRAAEELSCDALVVEALPGRARAYAEGLLKTLEFLAASKTAVPSLATGAGSSHRLEERLVMIMKARELRRPSHLVRGALLAAAAIVILVSPARLQGRVIESATPAPPAEPVEPVEPTTPVALAPPGVSDMTAFAHQLALGLPPVPTIPILATVTEPVPPSAPTAITPSASDIDDAVLDLRRKQIEIESEMVRLEAVRMRLDQEIDRAMMEMSLAELRDKMQRYDEAGDLASVEELRHLIEAQVMESEFQAKRALMQIQLHETDAERRAELEYRVLRHQELMANGEEKAARQLQMEVRKMEQEMMTARMQASKRELQLQLQRIEAEEALLKAQQMKVEENRSGK